MKNKYMYVSEIFSESSVRIPSDEIRHLVKDHDSVSTLNIEIADNYERFDTYVATSVEKCIDHICDGECDVTSKTIVTLTAENVDRQMSGAYNISLLNCGPDVWPGDDLFEDLTTYDDMILIIDNDGYVHGRILKVVVH